MCEDVCVSASVSAYELFRMHRQQTLFMLNTLNISKFCFKNKEKRKIDAGKSGKMQNYAFRWDLMDLQKEYYHIYN